MSDTDVSGPLKVNVFWRFIRRFAEFLFVVLLGWRVKVEGLEHVPTEGGAVIAYNHHGYVDFVFAVWNIVRRMQRVPRMLAKAELWDSWKVAWIVRNAHAVPVHRDSSSGRSQALRSAMSALEMGDLVVLAPEQTISQSFDPLPMRPGAVRMAQRAGVPIIPVAGWGSHRLSTKGHPFQWIRRIPVSVCYGEPIHPGPDEDPVAVTRRLQQRMEEMVDQLQREYPDGTPAGEWWVPERLGGGAPPHEEVLAAHRNRTRREFGERGDAA